MWQSTHRRSQSKSRGDRPEHGKGSSRFPGPPQPESADPKQRETAGIDRQRRTCARLQGEDMSFRSVRIDDGLARTVCAAVVVGCAGRRKPTNAISCLSVPNAEPLRMQALVCERREGGIVIGSPQGDPIIPRRSLGTALRASQNACVLVEPVGSKLHPYPPKIRPLQGGLIFGGEGGIRTHVPGYPDHLISSQRRCDRFGTSPAGANCSTGTVVRTSPAEGRQ